MADQAPVSPDSRRLSTFLPLAPEQGAAAHSSTAGPTNKPVLPEQQQQAQHETASITAIVTPSAASASILTPASASPPKTTYRLGDLPTGTAARAPSISSDSGSSISGDDKPRFLKLGHAMEKGLSDWAISE